jgi:DNA polymerase-3 subunit delta'
MDNWGLIGHEWAVELLAGRIAHERISHAILITGPEGIGRRTFAKRLTQAMLCTERSAPCGICRTCDLIEREQHPDLHILTPQGSRIKIEEVRAMQGLLAMHPFEGRYRIAILPDFHQATEPAMDALLKTLEEPPSSTRLILTANAAESLLPTIRSRCQEIALRPVPIHEIVDALVRDMKLPPHEAALLARLSGGRPGWALATYAAAIEDLWMVLHSNRGGRFAYADTAAHSPDPRALLDVWQSWWRDVLLLAEGSRIPPLHADRLEQLQELAAQVEPQAAVRAINAVRSTARLLERSVNARLAIEVMLLEMPYL